MEKTTEPVSRRDFLGATALAASGAAGLGAAARTPNVRVGLYSITYLGLWYRGEGLTLEQVIQRAKDYGYEGIEIDGKRPHGNPLDLPKARCAEVRRRAADQGIEIAAVAANNDFSSPMAEHRQAQLVYLRELIRMTADLGVKTVRVFLAWPGVTKLPLPPGGGSYDIARPLWEEAHRQFSAEQIWAWCREGMREAARFAGDAGVTLALQNHRPVIQDHHDVLRMVRETDSPHLKVCLDAPIMPKKDAESVRQAALDVGSLQTLSHFGGEYERAPDGTIRGEEFYLPFVRALFEIGYNGFMDYELCHPLPVVDGQTVGIEYADKNARLAAEYMRGIIDRVKRESRT